MSGFAHERCEELGPHSKILSAEEISTKLAQVPGWGIVHDGMDKLERIFLFDTFAQALAFTNKVGDAAETQGHHPKLVTEWGRVTVSWWTHFLGGLHKNDFIMAARTDRLNI